MQHSMALQQSSSTGSQACLWRGRGVSGSAGKLFFGSQTRSGRSTARATSRPVVSLFGATKDKGTTKEKGTTKGNGRPVIDDVEDVGFRFDEGRQMWVRDDRYKGKSMTIVRPKSGQPYTVWPVMHTYLVQKGLKQVKQQEAINLVKSGKAVLVDVRLAVDFDTQHAEGAVNVPMYRITAGDSGWDKLKRVVMGSIFMRATERDPAFLANLEKVAPKGKKVILMCGMGGSLDTVVRVETTGKQCNDPERNFGRETRSLKACYELMRAGWKDVVHLQGGLSEWRFQGYPLGP